MTQLSTVGVNNIIKDKNKKVRSSTILAILRALFSDDEERILREFETFKILQRD